METEPVEVALTGYDWTETVVALSIFGGAILFALALTVVIPRLVHLVTRSSETDLDEVVGRALKRPFVLLAAIWGAASGFEVVSYVDDPGDWITRSAVAVSILVVTVVVRRVALIILNRQATRGGRHGRLHPGSLPLIRRGVTILVFAAGFLVVIDTLGLTISPLLAGLGIGGIAVALALQPLLGNVFASSYMLSDSSIRVGDVVEVDAGPVGYVDDIGWRATRIRTFDNNIVILPNATLADSQVTNYTLTAIAADSRVTVRLAYEEDLDHVESVARDVLVTLREEWPTTVKSHEPVVLYTAFAESHVELLLKMRSQTWVDSVGLTHEMIKRIHGRFADEGITINYPARRLLMQPGDVDGLDALLVAAGDRGQGERIRR